MSFFCSCEGGMPVFPKTFYDIIAIEYSEGRKSLKQKIVIVDGNSLINRAYFAMSELKNSKGVYTGGAYGLIKMIMSLTEQFNPSHFCVAFDMKGPTKRHEAYAEYKGTRKGMPEELAMQMPIAKDLLDALKISRIEFQGYEADDLIGTLSKRALDEGFEVNVVTGDKDALQLVAIGARVHITKKGISELKLYTDDTVMEELGVHADQVIDFKGLSGDSSDNIPGIPGVGPKTAAKLLTQFKTVENLVSSFESVENKRIRGLVETYKEQALLSKKLATIMLEVPLDFTMDAFVIETPDSDVVVDRFRYYELSNLLQKYIASEDQHTEVKEIEYDLKPVSEIVETIKKNKAFDMKLYQDKTGDALVCASFCVNNKVFLAQDPNAINEMAPVFKDKNIAISGYDLKRDLLYLFKHDIDVDHCHFDGYIAAYLLDPSRRNYDLSEVYYEYTTQNLPSEEAVFGKGAKKKNFEDVDEKTIHVYAASEIFAIHKLNETFQSKLKASDLMDLFEEVEMPLVKILAEMEYTGFKVDMDQVNHIDGQLNEKLTEIEKAVYDLAGETFNINSPKQLGVILFEKLELPPVKKTKTGYSTSHDVLEKLASKHPIISEIMDYRIYAKLKSTYIDGLKAVMDLENSRVHTSLNQTVTMTGRLSSTEPNLQNIPIRLPYGRKIRRFFVADEGCTLLDADYSQIELRILAHLSGDKVLIEAFKNELDIHAITASQVFGIDQSEVTGLQRSRAKEVNFGIIYGMGDYGLSESLGISRKEAKTYIENYFKSYPSVEGFMHGIIEKCKEKGYVETILKRRRAVPDIDAKNFMLRSSAERIARNTPIQGSAADVIKLAMIRVANALQEKGLKSKLILQVHDELILNVPNNELEDVKQLLKENMENAIDLKVPLKVDMSTGASWYDAK